MAISRRSLIQYAAIAPVIAGGSLALSGCWKTGGKAVDELTIGMVTFPGYAPLYVAQQFALFGDTKVDLVRIESIGDLRAAMLAGRIDAYLATYDIFQSIQGRAPIGKMIYAIDTSVGADGFVADASVKDVAGIVGQKIGAEPGFPPHFVLTYMLYKLGKKLSDVTLIDMPSGDVPSAFASKRISVAATYEPYLSKCLELSPGSKLLASSKDLPGLVTDFIVASETAIATKRPALEKVIQGWNLALQRIAARADESYAVMGKAFGVSAQEMKEFAGVVKWLSDDDNKRLYASTAEDSVYRRFDEVNAALRLNDAKTTAAAGKDFVIRDFIKA